MFGKSDQISLGGDAHVADIATTELIQYVTDRIFETVASR
jgi:hypothetical protein